MDREGDKDWVLTWRKALFSEHGPPKGTTRLLLLYLSTFGNNDGSRVFPGTRTLAEGSRYSRRTVEEHLRIAAELGWIQRKKIGDGRGWRKWTKYKLTIPDPVAERLNLHTPGEEESASPSREVRKKTHLVRQGFPQTLPNTLPRKEHMAYRVEGDRFPPVGRLPKHNGIATYPDEFEATWQAYPKRAGGNPKKAAYTAWRARVEEGVDPVAIHKGVQRYAAYCRSEEQGETKWVKQAKTFFGPDEQWTEEWAPGKEQDKSGKKPSPREDTSWVWDLKLGS